MRCAACGATGALEAELLYTNIEKKYWIVMLSSYEEPRWREHEARVKLAFEQHCRLAGVSATQAGALAVRVVFGLAALREKVLCFDAGVDEAAIEALKLASRRPGAPPARLVEVDADEIVLAAPGAPQVRHPRAAVGAAACAPEASAAAASLRGKVYVDAQRLQGRPA